jgi:elongator complex protein 1
MLERNGLRHGGFELREEMVNWRDGKVRGLRWNSDSEILAIWISRDGEDVGGFPLNCGGQHMLTLQCNYGR